MKDIQILVDGFDQIAVNSFRNIVTVQLCRQSGRIIPDFGNDTVFLCVVIISGRQRIFLCGISGVEILVGPPFAPLCRKIPSD